MPSVTVPNAVAIAEDAEALHKNFLRHHDANLPPILAAVAALTDSIESYHLHTVAETLSLLSTGTDSLKAQAGLAVGAGAGAFRRWLVQLLERPHAGRTLDPPFAKECASDDFEDRKRWIVEAGRAYVAHGIAAKYVIAKHIASSFRELDTPSILVPNCDEVVNAVLLRFAEENVPFQVFLVDPPYPGLWGTSPAQQRLETLHNDLQPKLQGFSINVTNIPPQALASFMASRDGGSEKMVIASADLLCSNGAVAAPLGTCQAAFLAHTLGVPFFVAAEKFKAVDFFPLHGRAEQGKEWLTNLENHDTQGLWLDVTAAHLVRSIVTEKGFVSPSQISDQFIRSWF